MDVTAAKHHCNEIAAWGALQPSRIFYSKALSHCHTGFLSAAPLRNLLPFPAKPCPVCAGEASFLSSPPQLLSALGGCALVHPGLIFSPQQISAGLLPAQNQHVPGDGLHLPSLLRCITSACWHRPTRLQGARISPAETINCGFGRGKTQEQRPKQLPKEQRGLCEEQPPAALLAAL